MPTEQTKRPELSGSFEPAVDAETLRKPVETSGLAEQPKNVANETARLASHFSDAEAAGDDATSETELDKPQWAVISFDRCEAANLNYDEATATLAELEAKGATGLCIVTDRTAARLAA